MIALHGLRILGDLAFYYAFAAFGLALCFVLDHRRAFVYKNKPSELCHRRVWYVCQLLMCSIL